MRTTRGLALLAALAMTTGMAGCGEGGQPEETATSTASPRVPDEGGSSTSSGSSDGSGSSSGAGGSSTSEASSGSSGATDGASGSSDGASGSDDGASGSDATSGGGSGTSGGGDLPKGMPAAAKEKSKEGAAAFGEYYFLEFGEASHTGKTNNLGLLGLGSCPPCDQAVQDINSDAQAGRTRSADPYSISQTTATKRPDKGYKVSMTVDVSAHHVYENGKIIGDVDSTQYQLTEHVVWKDNRWWMSDWAIS